MKQLLFPLLLLMSIISDAQVKVDTSSSMYKIITSKRELSMFRYANAARTDENVIKFDSPDYGAWKDFMVYKASNDTVWINPEGSVRVIIWSEPGYYQYIEPGTVMNRLPIVNAGRDTTVTVQSFTLKGEAYDKDGSIVKVNWRQVSGPTAYNPTPNNLNPVVTLWQVVGVYEFELTATDDKNGTSSDRVTVTRKKL